MRRAGALALASLVAALAPPIHAQGELTRVPLAVTVAVEEGAPVTDEAWLGEQLAEANRIFAAADVGFELAERHAMTADHAHLETRADRHRLGALLHEGVADVFVVASLRDVDDPSLMRRGVHWRPAGMPGAHFVIVVAGSWSSVLAHELGHYFGNPHSPTPGNVMSYDRGEVPPFFDAGQVRRIRRSLRRFVGEGSLRIP